MKTTFGFFPPISSATFLKSGAAFFAMSAPATVLPVKERVGISACRAIAAPTVPPRPWTMLSTPPGRPASRQISASMNAVTGVSSDGFATAVFPVARAGAIFHVRR